MISANIHVVRTFFGPERRLTNAVVKACMTLQSTYVAKYIREEKSSNADYNIQLFR